jgi:phage shock protein PspC (stress-responsive transcriptional regulator)
VDAGADEAVVEPRRLYRSREDRWIAGVCGGLGRFFGVDPMPIRIAFIILSLWQGIGVLLYLIMILIVPDEPTGQVVTDPHIPQEHGMEDPQAQRVRILGVILVLGGIYLLIRTLGFLPVNAERLTALALIAAGFIILVLRPGRI